MGGSYKGLLSLVRHEDQDGPCGLFWIILSAVFHLRTLQITGYFGPEISHHMKKQTFRQFSSRELFASETLVTILQKLRYNTHAVLEHHVSHNLSSLITNLLVCHADTKVALMYF